MPKISELPVATALNPADEFAIIQVGVTKQITTANVLKAVYPIGSIFISVVSTNPATLLGFGTWAAFAAGRVLAGLGAAPFDVAEAVGGEETHVLSRPEMPGHTHIQDPHTHATIQVQGGVTAAITGTHVMTSVAVGGVSRATTAPELANAATAVNQASGGGLPHNNLQPYIVVYMWKRTA